MAYVQDARPPENRRLDFVIEDFSGGLNNRTNIINDNQSSDMLNLAFTYDDVLEKRKGFKRYDDFVLPGKITYLSMFKPYAGEDELIRATDTEVYSNQTKIADVQGTIDAINFQGNLYFVDGEDMYVYGKLGTTTGIYTKIVGSHPEGNTVLKVVNPPEGYEPLDEVHQRGVTVYDYNEGTVHYEPCIHELDDVYLGANLLPQHPQFIEIHNGRIYVSGDREDDDNVFITDVQTPYYFAVGMPLQLPPNSDKVLGMTVYDNAIVVGREYDIYYISGETNNPELGFELFTLNRINSHTGIANNKTLTRVHNYLFFLGSDGIVYALSNVNVDSRLLATQIISQTIDMYKAPISADSSMIRNASAVFDSESYYIQIGDRTLIYNYRHRAWTIYDYVDMQAPFYYYDRIIWGRSNGIVAEFGDDYLDDGRPVYSFWESKAFDMGRPSHYKQLREFYLVAHAYDDNDSDIRVTFEIDYANVLGEAEVVNMLAIWGKARFGDRFIDRNINASIPFMIGRRAKFMRVRFENGYRVNTRVATFNDLHDVRRKYDYMGAYVDDVEQYHYYYRGWWYPLDEKEVNQAMRVYQVNGEYELKGKR